MTVNGATVRPGDVIGTGTISGPETGQRGCLLELSWNGRDPIELGGGETRTYLEACLAAKEQFIEVICEDLQDGDPQLTHVTKAKFNQVFIPAFCRSSNLRQFLMHKTASLATKTAKKALNDYRESE